MKHRDRQEEILDSFRRMLREYKAKGGVLEGRVIVVHPTIRHELRQLTRAQRMSIQYLPLFYDPTCPIGNAYIVERSVVLASRDSLNTNKWISGLYERTKGYDTI